MTHDRTATNPESRLFDTGRLIILLVAPAHDKLTEYTSKLLENVPNLGAPTIFCNIKSPLTYDDLLSQHYIDPSATDIALIFCGHGEAYSLEGPGAPPNAPDYKTARSPFFDQSHVPIGPKFLLAFCSNSAIGLGDLYERNTTGCTFVGFNDEIGFVMGGGEYADTWRKILYGTASAMLSAPDALTLEKFVIGLYKDALSYFSPDRDRKNEWGLIMRGYLRKQMEAINFVRT